MADETPQAGDRLNPAAYSGMLVSAGDRIREALLVTDKTTHDVLEEANLAARRCFKDAYERAERPAAEQMEKLASVSEELLALAATIQQKIYQLNQVVEQSMDVLASELEIERSPSPRQPNPSKLEGVPSQDNGDPGATLWPGAV